MLAAAAAKLLQSCPTLCDPTDGSPPGSPIPGIFNAYCVHSEGDQPWDFFGRNDGKAETQVLWPPHAKS